MPSDPAELKYSVQKRNRRGEFRTCPQCGKEFYLQPSRVKRGERYCSHACQLAAVPKVDKICPVCGKQFTIFKSIADRYTVCSIECRHANVQRSICKRCGKEFRTSEKRYARHYCSEECRRPPNYQTCRNCGKQIRVEPADTDRQFCSFSCYRTFQGETLPEKQVRQTLDVLNIKYIQEAQMGRYSVDFLLVDLRIALEIDGVYWHQNIKRDTRKTNYLQSKGWNVIRISDIELDNIQDVAGLIISRIKTVSDLNVSSLQPPLF